MGTTDAPELTPGALEVSKSRTLPSGHRVDFEFAPAGWLLSSGEPRKRDYRRYYFTEPDGDAKRRETVSVTTICDAIMPKNGLTFWAERRGIEGAMKALRHGMLTADTANDDAVYVVRSNQLGMNAARDDAADRGLNVHAILERFMLTGNSPNPADHPEPHRPFIRGLVKWLLWAEPEPVAVEMLVGDPERGYAGRLDLLARIDGKLTLVDLKTQERGAIYESAHIQVRLYRDAEERHGEHAIEDARIVVVNGYGAFRETELLADSEMASRALAYYAPIKRLSSACDSENRVIRAALNAKADELTEASA